MQSTLCKCGQPRRTSGRDCLACHAAATRRYRKLTPLVGEARARNNALRYAKVYVERGKIKRKPCIGCGSMESRVHLSDYRKPKKITWLCKSCLKSSTRNNQAVEANHGA